MCRPTGGLNVGKKGNKSIQDVIDSSKAIGAPVEVISNTEIQRRYGLTYTDEFIGVVDSDAGILEATKAVAALHTLIKAWGGVILDSTKVVDIVPGATVTVKTATTSFTARKVVLVPGGWAGPMFAKLGLDVCVSTVLVCMRYGLTVLIGRSVGGGDQRRLLEDS